MNLAKTGKSTCRLVYVLTMSAWYLRADLETLQRWSAVDSHENMQCLGWSLGFSGA